ncbi:uncharacterized protein G2W53_027560 [Senna tora]|uniref:BED-type domain-containing protein n=1 Tax=Senna tora TaxID=362788 RepID=A0A834THX6_9FABA|nr:uncharacterized protein G2W53_027560 [Senna tora]
MTSQSPPIGSGAGTSASGQNKKRKNALDSRTDVSWKHGHVVDGDSRKVECKYCKKIYTVGAYRFKHHLVCTSNNVEPCVSVPDDVKKEMLTILVKSTERPSKENLSGVGVHGETDKEMCELIAKHGPGFKPPTFHKVREKFLKQEVEETKNLLEQHKLEWKKKGCTIMSDGWTDRKRRSIVNFLVNSPKGTVFLSSKDVSDVSKTTEKVFEMLDEIFEQVGEENVVQVITDNAANYKATGELLMAKRKRLFGPLVQHTVLI